QAS
ncbi:putative aTP-binding protein FecE, partial [Vibrio parahaemolyticus EKP-028]